MNQIAQRQESSINQIGISSGSGGSKIAPQSLGEVVRFAEVMAKADIALPKHLRGNPGACMAVALQALEWEMSPFAVASKSYAVNGAIAYEAQLIAAVVNTRSGIKGRLKYAYDGTGDAMTCTVTGVLDGEECSYTSPKVSDITPKNSPLWKTDPQQQLGYYSARSWARRHTPEVILGVYDRDEAQQFQGPDNAKDVTPLVDRLKANTASGEGFSAEHVVNATSFDFETSSGESIAPDDQPGAAADEQGDAAPGADANQVGGPDPDADEPEGASNGDDSASGATPPYAKLFYQECADKFIALATDKSVSQADRYGNLKPAKDAWKQAMPNDLDFVKQCLVIASNIAKGDLDAAEGKAFLYALRGLE